MEAARARVAPSMAFDADSANNRGSPSRVRGPRFPFVYSSLMLREASGDGWAGRLGDGAPARVRQPLAPRPQLLRAQTAHIAAPQAQAMEKEPAPSTPTEAKAPAAEAKEDHPSRLPSKEDPNRLPSFIPRTGLVFSERTAFAPVLCPPKLLPIRPYHVQRGQAQDSDDDEEAPPPKEGEEKKTESTTDVYDKRYLAEKKLVGDWGREPVVDEGYDPSKPLELVQKPAAEPAAAS